MYQKKKYVPLKKCFGARLYLDLWCLIEEISKYIAKSAHFQNHFPSLIKKNWQYFSILSFGPHESGTSRERNSGHKILLTCSKKHKRINSNGIREIKCFVYKLTTRGVPLIK